MDTMATNSNNNNATNYIKAFVTMSILHPDCAQGIANACL